MPPTGCSACSPTSRWSVNIALIFGVLSLIGSTLTLPGIAGIVLTMGIAVDANVLINERIREEIRSGKSPVASIEAGYQRAMTTIIDSNMTTLISTLVLFWLGSGRGARICRDPHHRHSRLHVHRRDPDAAHGVLLAALDAARPDPDLGKTPPCSQAFISSPPTRRSASSDADAPSVGWFRPADRGAASARWKVGLNFGIDFQGGTLIEIQTKESVADLADIRAKVHGLNLGEVQIQEFGAPNDVLIRVAAQPTEQEQQASIAKVKQVLGDQVEYRRIEVVGTHDLRAS